MHEQTATGTAIHDGIAQLNESMEKTMDQNRELFAEMARFTRDESFRLAHMQLERADHVFAQLNGSKDLPGLIGIQQEWIRDMMKEYAAQSLRYAEMFRTLASHAHPLAETGHEKAHGVNGDAGQDEDDEALSGAE